MSISPPGSSDNHTPLPQPSPAPVDAGQEAASKVHEVVGKGPMPQVVPAGPPDLTAASEQLKKTDRETATYLAGLIGLSPPDEKTARLLVDPALTEIEEILTESLV